MTDIIQVVFTNSKLPLSPIIRTLTWSDWSHVALMRNGYIIEAVGSGVRKDTFANLVGRSKNHHVVDFSVKDALAIWAAAESQIGKGYDWTPLLGIPFHRDWQETDRWFCSELVAWAFEKGGTPLFVKDVMHRVVPQHIYMVHPTRTD